MADILSKINSKDTLEILGCSTPNVFENRTHTQSIIISASGEKGISVYFFLFFETFLSICNKRFSSVLIFGTVHQNIDYQLKEPTRVTSLARSLASLGNTLVSKFLLVLIII